MMFSRMPITGFHIESLKGFVMVTVTKSLIMEMILPAVVAGTVVCFLKRVDKCMKVGGPMRPKRGLTFKVVVLVMTGKVQPEKTVNMAADVNSK